MGEAKQEVEAKQEEKKGEKAEAKQEEAKPAGPPPPIVLSMDLHCVGCAKKIEKYILKCKDVQSVEVDTKQNLVEVKGMVDPQALCSRIQKRTQRQVQVLSPLPPAEGDSRREAAEPQESGMATVELLVNMHCEACAEQLKRKILKMRGVQSAETDMIAGKVTVTGTVTGEKMVEYIHRRSGKIASIVPPPPPQEEEKKKEEEKKPKEIAPEEKKEEKGGETKEQSNEKKGEEKAPEAQENASEKEDGAKEEEKREGRDEANAGITSVVQEDMAKRMMHHWHGNFIGEEEMARRMMMHHWMPVYMIEQPPPPQLFSDENPNACCIT